MTSRGYDKDKKKEMIVDRAKCTFIEVRKSKHVNIECLEFLLDVDGSWTAEIRRKIILARVALLKNTAITQRIKPEDYIN